jgi:hypothetical protein
MLLPSAAAVFAVVALAAAIDVMAEEDVGIELVKTPIALPGVVDVAVLIMTL